MALPKPVERILFVCYGNLCRSVLAEALMKRLLRTRGLEQISVKSAGIVALPDQPAPRPVVEVAQEHGLDLTGHRSRPLDGSLLRWADIVIVMESYMRDEITRTWPEMNENSVLLLGSFSPGHASMLEIEDPYGGSSVNFHQCYAAIEAGVEGLLTSLLPEGILNGNP